MGAERIFRDGEIKGMIEGEIKLIVALHEMLQEASLKASDLEG